MALEKYNEKRDFSKTKEPKGIKKNSKDNLKFVVQKHAASRLHYDFRLEIDGVLVSWAVPKGPSSNPSDRRLAVQTEDHPMDYLDFEGTIPKEEYGGGTVMVWDIGTYHAEGSDTLAEDRKVLRRQLREGSLKVTLEGKKLKGSWHIVRMKGEDRQWLLMKAKDDFANQKEYESNSVLSGLDFKGIEKTDAVWGETKRPGDEKSVSRKTVKATKVKETATDAGFTAEDLQDAVKVAKFPYEWRPQLATLADEAFDNDDWIFETKYDGYRALAQLEGKKVQLISRNGLSFNSKYSALIKALETIDKQLILDGEIVVEDSKGKSSFQSLQHLEDFPDKGVLKFYVFDILYFAGFDLRQLELIDRKKILKALLPKHKNIIYSEHTVGKGIRAFETIQKKGGEGIIAKRASSKYHNDKRTKDWLKIKTDQQQEMVIGGFTEPSGSRKGLGALLCGYYKDKNFEYAGKVGTGFTQVTLEDLRKKLNRLERKTPPFIDPPKMPGVHWVKPELIAQIKFSEFTETGSMRHPVYLGLREDKKTTEVKLEQPKVEAEEIDNAKTKTNKSTKTAKSSTGKRSQKVEFSNLDKMFWPDLKITKGHVVDYYDSIADYILPYLKDRPQSLRRTPDGIKTDGFFQKDVAGKVPKWIKTRKIKSESKEDPIEYLLCQDKDTLLFLANWGCIELNPWSSRVGSLNNPDYIIFDIDPKDAPIKSVVATALKVKEILDQLKVPAYIKTSGGNGLHIFIPVKPKYNYEQTREFSHLISQMVHRDLPKITSLERMPTKRKGKVYLDFLQNGKGKTMASIYSLRPREGATISVPLEWSEVNSRLNLKKFNLKTIAKRLEEKGDLWKDIFSDAIDLKEILKGMG